MQKFNLEKEYQKYLETTKQDEAKMNPVQALETKRAFFGACGQMLILFRDEIGGIEDEDQAIEAMQDLLNQVGDFWNKQLNQVN